MYVTRHSVFNTGPLSHGSAAHEGVRQAFGRFLAAQESETAASVARPWSPRVDIREDEQRFVILADVPGIDPSLIEVSMDKGVLSIKGERRFDADQVENNGQGDKFTRLERAHGVFDRRFNLPESADAEGITASGSYGVLEIVIPKKALPTPRRITINSGH